MGSYLGIDISNYTTSAALFESGEGVVLQKKKLLPVNKGEKGLRQSDAVFHHTIILPQLVEELLALKTNDISAVGVSVSPRDAEGSYMPCFLAGVSAARCIAASCDIPLYSFSHQAGHVAAALYSADKLELLNNNFIAFHISGGTTEALLVLPDDKKIMKTEILCRTLDLNAGQAVDRIGVMLGLTFPCGSQVDKLAQNSTRSFRITPNVKDGNCNLSGLENQCADMFKKGESAEDICRYCIEYIATSLQKMTEFTLEKCGSLPLVFSGGVMANSIIRQRFSAKYGAFFAEPEFSSDNAAGVAVLASLSDSRRG